MSHAINRQEIIDLIYVGQGAPAQVAPQPEHELFNERMATQYTAVRSGERANEMLDKILPKKDAEGYRLDTDGKRFTINFMVADVFGLSYPDVMLMVQKYAKAVGLDIQIRATDRARLNTMWYANEQEAYIWNCVGGLVRGLHRRALLHALPEGRHLLRHEVGRVVLRTTPAGEEPPAESQGADGGLRQGQRGDHRRRPPRQR